MPKSKRNKIVHLTQVKKKGKDHKEDLMKQLEQYVHQFGLVYLFELNETKSDRIMNLRLGLKEHGRIFAGRNSLVSLTLRSIGRRTRTNYASLVGQITGHRGLFFTNLERDKLVRLLEGKHPEFRNKLLGYAQLKATDEDSVDSGPSEGDDDDDDGGQDEADDGKEPAMGRRRIAFRPIEKSVKARKGKNKSAGQKMAPMEIQ